jgi:hypothetical protein
MFQHFFASCRFRNVDKSGISCTSTLLISKGVSIMRIVFALAISITIGLSISAAHADWRHYRYYGWQQRLHPDNIYVPHCRGGWVSCGRDSAKHHEDANPQQR